MGRTYLIFLLLMVAVAVTRAALPSQVYWNTVLPNTPLPGAIRDVLEQKSGTSVTVDGKRRPWVDVSAPGTHVGVGGGGVGVSAPGTHVGVGGGGVGVSAPGTHVGVGGGGVGVSAPGTHVGVGGDGVGVSAPGTHVGVGGGGVGVSAPGTHVGVGGDGVGVSAPGTHVGVGGGGVGVHVHPYYHHNNFDYRYAATETQIHDDPNVALFFLEKDLHPGAKITLHFTRTLSVGATFLPRGAAESIPFSSSKLTEILARFSVQPNSVEAEAMKQTLKECEEPETISGESKLCATSLESMVDFATTSLGTTRVQAVSTAVGREGSPEQEYTVASAGARRMAGDRSVACHSQPYAYAVFYCHVAGATRAYSVPLVGKDGTTAEAVAVCHTDTATWNPKHLAFQVLKVKPGTVPICHFLPQDHVVWTPKN